MEKENIILGLLGIIFMSAIFYIGGSFMAASFDVRVWNEEARGFVGIIWIILTMFISFFSVVDIERL